MPSALKLLFHGWQISRVPTGSVCGSDLASASSSGPYEVPRDNVRSLTWFVRAPSGTSPSRINQPRIVQWQFTSRISLSSSIAPEPEPHPAEDSSEGKSLTTISFRHTLYNPNLCRPGPTTAVTQTAPSLGAIYDRSRICNHRHDQASDTTQIPSKMI